MTAARWAWTVCLTVLLLLGAGCQQMALDKLGEAGAEWHPSYDEGASYDVSFDDYPEKMNDDVLKSLIDELEAVRPGELGLNGSTGITDASVPYLLRLDTVRTLYIYETQITGDGVRRLLSNHRLRFIYVDTSQVPQGITEEQADRLGIGARDRDGERHLLDWAEFQATRDSG